NTLSLGLPFAAAGSPAAAVASTMVQSSGNCLRASVARVPAAPIGRRGSRSASGAPSGFQQEAVETPGNGLPLVLLHAGLVELEALIPGAITFDRGQFVQRGTDWASVVCHHQPAPVFAQQLRGHVLLVDTQMQDRPSGAKIFI